MLLDVEKAAFSYHPRAQVLHDVSFAVPVNQIVGLIGPNGSGKSTLIKVIVDLLALHRGSIRIDSRRNDERVAKMSTLYIASNDNMPDFLTGEEYLKFIHGLYGERIDLALIARLFDRYQMTGRSRDLIEDYSHGMRKKLQLISALTLRRKLTIIDETLNGIDIDALFAFESDVKSLADRHRSVILCSHDFALLERVADRVLLLNRGALGVDAGTSELIDEYGSLDNMVREILEVMR